VCKRILTCLWIEWTAIGVLNMLNTLLSVVLSICTLTNRSIMHSCMFRMYLEEGKCSPYWKNTANFGKPRRMSKTSLSESKIQKVFIRHSSVYPVAVHCETARLVAEPRVVNMRFEYRLQFVTQCCAYWILTRENTATCPFTQLNADTM
jgi:hypothetical protein